MTTSYRSLNFVLFIVMITNLGCGPDQSTKPNTPGPSVQNGGEPSTREQVVQGGIKSDRMVTPNTGLGTLLFAADDERDTEGRLVAISIRKKDVKLADLAELEEAASIQRLNAGSAELSDNDMAFLPALTGLEKLELGINANITDAGLSNLKSLKKLRILSVAFCPQLTGSGFADLADLDNLVMLNISHNENVTDESLKHLQELESLQVVKAKLMLGITDAGLKHLAQINDLRRLSFESKLVTNSGLNDLAKLANVEELDLRGCTGLTADGIKQLQQALPDCRIAW